MKYRKAKLVCGILVCSLAMTTITACSLGDDSATEESAGINTFAYEEDANEEDPVSTTVSATVESVDDNVITLSIGGGSEMGGAPGEGGEAPSGEAPSSSDGSVPEKPDGESDSTDSTSDTSADGGAPEMPSGEAPSNSDGSVPENPDGESDSTGSSESSSDVNTDDSAPEMPSGEAPSDSDGSVPEKLDGDGEIGGESVAATLTIGDASVIYVEDDDEEVEGSLDDIKEDSYLEITFDEDGEITKILVTEGKSSSTANIDYTAVVEYTEDTDVDDEEYTSTGTDENAIHIFDDAEVALSGITVDRTSEDSTGGDNASFYGVGAAILTTDGTAYITDADITTDASGGAGVFSYSDGVTYISDSTITTTQDTSGGIHAAGGGTLYAWDLDVTTDGESAAAIRSDRGGGTMVINGGTYTSNGVGSPAVYCTADIAINNATLTATGSEAICMEGLNTIHLYDCDITGDMDDLEQNDSTWTIIVYQSMSGDSEVGNSTMQIVGGSITSKNGGLIYTTNTEADILLSDVDITYADDCEYFLMCTGNTNERGWGTEGANGSDCTFTADDQEMEGNVIWDSISQLDFYMTNGSSLTGAIIDDETYAGEGGDGHCNVYISKDSTWTVTGDSTVTNLYNAGKIIDASGKTVTIVGTDGTVYVQGTSNYTITVNNYSTSVSLDGASSAASWSDFKVEKPDELS